VIAFDYLNDLLPACVIAFDYLNDLLLASVIVVDYLIDCLFIVCKFSKSLFSKPLRS